MASDGLWSKEGSVGFDQSFDAIIDTVLITISEFLSFGVTDISAKTYEKLGGRFFFIQSIFENPKFRYMITPTMKVDVLR